MQIDITNGRRFSDMPVGDLSSESDIVLARLADGTGVKQISMTKLRKFLTGDIEELTTEDKTSIVAAINELVSADEGMAADIETLQSIAAVINYHNAGAHNAIYRGKYLGDSLTSEQSAAIRDGSFKDLYIGDYWTINGVNWRIMDFDYWLNCGDTACTTHHAVIVPDSCLYNAQMNTSNVTTGGYTGSAMYTSNLASAKTTISNAFGAAHILNHRELLCNAVSNGLPSGWSWFDSTVDLMNEHMVYGSSAWGQAAQNGYNIGSSKNQLAGFRLRHDLQCNRDNWWLRDVTGALAFANVNDSGFCNSVSASNSVGVRPAFPIY